MRIEPRHKDIFINSVAQVDAKNTDLCFCDTMYGQHCQYLQYYTHCKLFLSQDENGNYVPTKLKTDGLNPVRLHRCKYQGELNAHAAQQLIYFAGVLNPAPEVKE